MMTPREWALRFDDKIIGQHLNAAQLELLTNMFDLGIEAAEEAKAKEEREAIIQIIDADIEEWKKWTNNEKPIRELISIKNKIRARSEGEKPKPESLLTFDSLCKCGHVYSDHFNRDDQGNEGPCRKQICMCREFQLQSEGEKKGE